MPRKSKRSQATKLQWQQQRESQCAAPCEQAEGPGPQSRDLVRESVVSPAEAVNQAGQRDAVCVPQVSYADVVKRGRHSETLCVAESVQMHQHSFITSTDLDRVLDKGNVLYKQARQMFPQHAHLTTDELPDLVPAHRHVFHADKTLLSRYGTLGDPLPGAVDSFLDLEAGLSCLLSDVQYALLLMTGLCIAVFRTRSGRYSFFDPHPRGEDVCRHCLLVKLSW
ncbi:uncharacterized protein AKAME5_002993500 [Lates japonicus]|uniref:Uncharacterized protein n=1 Tax=Lates japonicus TaxID=270547 RepID=A0AAD3MTB3_LATJO|nr:uncharacterized protein AKAME5_002993500 [Lates japonicus]